MDNKYFKVEKGDLFDIEDEPVLILHGVNRQLKMASGVAKEIRSRFPFAYRGYMNECNPIPELGDARFYNDGNIIESSRVYIGNCYTQDRYGYDGKAYADLSAIMSSYRLALEFCSEYDIYNIYMPMIGCGLGGLKWIDNTIIDDKEVDLGVGCMLQFESDEWNKILESYECITTTVRYL